MRYLGLMLVLATCLGCEDRKATDDLANLFSASINKDVWQITLPDRLVMSCDSDVDAAIWEAISDDELSWTTRLLAARLLETRFERNEGCVSIAAIVKEVVSQKIKQPNRLPNSLFFVVQYCEEKPRSMLGHYIAGVLLDNDLFPSGLWMCANAQIVPDEEIVGKICSNLGNRALKPAEKLAIIAWRSNINDIDQKHAGALIELLLNSGCKQLRSMGNELRNSQ